MKKHGPWGDWKVQRTLMDRPRLRVKYTRRGRDAHMGRFGGGWQWSVGVEAGPILTRLREGKQATITVSLLVAYVCFDINPRAR